MNKIYYLKKKHYLTLLEMLVAMFILTLLLTVIFGFFRELSKMEEWTKYQQTLSFQKRYVESRFFYFTSRILNESDSETKEIFSFFEEPLPEDFSQNSSLVFTYNNGVRKNPLFSGNVISRLYVNKEKQLCLATWPMQSKDQEPVEMQKEILLDGVEGMRFEFFAAPLKNMTPAQETPPGMVRGGWDDKWGKTYKQLPALLKIYLNTTQPPILQKENSAKEEEIVYLFYLPISTASKNFIQYDK